MESTKTLRWLNVLGLLAALSLNGLANALPLNGYNTGELSDMYPNLFVPAGFTFGIWGVIYIFLIGVVIIQFREASESWVKRIGPWFFVSSMANASWILAWHFLQVGLSLLIMGIILLSLILLFLRLNISSPADQAERWWVRPAFSIYLGWISVATVANVTTLLVDQGWNGGSIGPVTWTAIMISIVSLLGLLMIWRTGAIPYVLVLLWAFYGIYSKQSGNTGADVQPILRSLMVGAALLLVGIAVDLYRKQKVST